jgi:hypothetical protein
MSMLQGAKSEVQCRRTRSALHQLPAGRGGMYRDREQAEEVSDLSITVNNPDSELTRDRRRKHHFVPKPLDTITEQFHQHQRAHGLSGADALANGSVNPIDISNPVFRRSSESSGSVNDDEDHHGLQQHVPHALCKSIGSSRVAIEANDLRSISKPEAQ